MKTFNRPLLTIALIIVLFAATLQSCYRKFYKVSDKPDSTANYDSAIQVKSDKYFILRSGNRAFHMQNVTMNKDNKTLACKLAMVDLSHTKYLVADKKKGLPYHPANGDDVILDEVHFYIPSDESLQYDTNYVLDFNKISKIETLEKDKKRTSLSTVLSTSGIVLTLVALSAIIISSATLFTW